MKLLFSKKFAKIYEKIVGGEITDDILFFLRELKYAIIGYGIAGFCVFVFEMLAGRILGPAEYGKYVLASVVGLFLYLFMTLGANIAVIKYGAVGETEAQKKIISASYLVVILSSLFFGLLFFIFSEKISSILSLPLSIFRLSIIFGILFALYTISTDSLRALYNIKRLSFFRAIYGILMLSALLYLFSSSIISFEVVVLAVCLPYLFIFLVISLTIRKHLSFGIGKTLLKKILEYGLYAAVGGSLFTFLPSISQIFVNKYLTISDVGIYSAYYFSSITFAIFFYNIFIVVFFPAVSRYEQKELILKKIGKVVPVLFLAGVPILFIFQLVALNIYGDKYPLNFGLMLLFGFSTVLICVYGLYSWFFYSTGISGVKKVTILTIFLLIADVFLNFYLVPLLSLWGAILATFFTYTAGLVCLYLFFIKNQNKIIIKNSQTKIKICHVASSDLTIRFILLNLLVFIKKQGYDVYAVCSPGKWIKDIENRGIKIKQIVIKRKVFTPLSDLAAFVKLIFYFKKEKIDIVHTHTPKAGFLGRIAAKIAGVPIIIHTNHGFHFQDNSSFIKRKIFIFLEIIGAKFSDVILSINKEDIETAVKEKICKREKIKYSGDGINTKLFNPANFSEEFINSERKRMGIGAGSKVIGFVGRLVEEKGILDLLEAMAVVKKHFPKLVLLVVGHKEPEKKDSIDGRIFEQHKLKENILFLGERTDMEKIYPLMDIFVLPSHREGLGLVLLEASAAGRPTVATNIRGCREAVGDGVTGILVPEKNPEKLAGAIVYLLQNPARAREMGIMGRKKIVNEFDESIIFDRIIKEGEKLINKKMKFL